MSHRRVFGTYSYEHVAKHPGWVEAMEMEISALQTNNT